MRRIHAILLPLLAALLFGASPASAATMAVQPDGKILLAGSTPLGSGYLARLLPDGEPDPAFGVDGIVVNHRVRSFEAIALQPDGSILALGNFFWGVARYGPEGRLDTSFGEDGYAHFSVINDPSQLLALPDGRILVGGDQDHKLFRSEALLVLLSADGLSQEWVNSASFATYMTDLAQGADGSVLMLAGGEEGLGRKALLARFVPGATPSYGNTYDTISYPHPDPGYDKTFGNGAGLLTLAWPGKRPPPFDPGPLAASPGSIFVAGAPGPRLALVRFGEDGVFDGSFGRSGFATLGGGRRSRGNATALAVTPEGKVVLLGDFRSRHSPPWCHLCRTPLLARFLPDGRRDGSFGSGGIARLAGIAGPKHGAEAGEMALLPGGKILATARSDEVRSRMVLGRFDEDGSPDPSFGAGGILRFEPCRGSEAAQRENGCLPSAQGELELHRRPSGEISLHLEISTRGKWGKVNSLRVQLPSSLALAPGRVDRARFSYRDNRNRVRRERPEVRAGALVFRRPGALGAERVVLAVPAGVLRPVGPAPEQFSFRIRVRFAPSIWASAGTQTLVLSGKPGQAG